MKPSVRQYFNYDVVFLVYGADQACHEHRHDGDENREEGDALRPEVAHGSVAVP